MSRPSKYSDFDPDRDPMYVLDLKKEEEIKDQIQMIQMSADPVMRRRNVETLQIERDLCRIRVKVSFYCNILYY